jgi:hypothetical protein
VSCLFFLAELVLALAREDALGHTRGLGKNLNKLMYRYQHLGKDICLFLFVFPAYIYSYGTLLPSLYNYSHLTVAFFRELDG